MDHEPPQEAQVLPQRVEVHFADGRHDGMAMQDGHSFAPLACELLQPLGEVDFLADEQLGAESQKMNDPAAQRRRRLRRFHPPTAIRATRYFSVMAMVLPPARTRPAWITSATFPNSPWLGCESASTKINHSPVATAAPAFRARLIWLMGSKTTFAPPLRASSAVRSVELLSQTMVSTVQPSSPKVDDAAAMRSNVSGISFSSLNAGMMIEIFTGNLSTSQPGKAHVVKAGVASLS